jgi:predicted RNase H-like nuclease (RuvC/YqgF family)
MNNKEATELVRRLPETFATIQEYIEKLERENAELQRELTALKINYAQDKENYQCAARAGIAVEEKLKHENETLRKSMKSITPFLAELVKVFDCAQTNGDLFDLADVCIKYRGAIDTARKEQREQKIKQMTDAASLDIGHSCLSGDKWMRDASYYGN